MSPNQLGITLSRSAAGLPEGTVVYPGTPEFEAVRAERDTERADRLEMLAEPVELPEPPALRESHVRRLSAIDRSPAPPLLLGRLDPLGPTIMYGPGDIGKGTLATSWAVRLQAAGHRRETAARQTKPAGDLRFHRPHR